MESTSAMTDEKKAIIWEQWETGSPMVQITQSSAKPLANVSFYSPYHAGLAWTLPLISYATAADQDP